MRRILQLALQSPASSQVRVRSVAAVQLPVLSLPYQAHVQRAGPRAQEAPRPRGLRRRHPQLAAARRVDAGRVNLQRDTSAWISAGMKGYVVLYRATPSSWRRRARGGKTIIGRSRTGTSWARRAIKTRDRIPAAIATACSA